MARAGERHSAVISGVPSASVSAGEARALGGAAGSLPEADLLRWAQSRLPEEACGLVLEEAGRIWAVELPNVAADRRRGFELDPGAVVDWLGRTEGPGSLRIRGVWHSHPDAPAVLSGADRRGALPGAEHWIVGRSATGEWELRVWGPEA